MRRLHTSLWISAWIALSVGCGSSSSDAPNGSAGSSAGGNGSAGHGSGTAGSDGKTSGGAGSTGANAGSMGTATAGFGGNTTSTAGAGGNLTSVAGSGTGGASGGAAGAGTGTSGAGAGGTSSATGGAAGSANAGAGGHANGGAGGASTGAGGASGGNTGASGATGSAGAGGATACSSPQIRITEVDVGASINVNEDEADSKPVMLSPIPSGGSRMSWYGADGKVHVTTLNADDTVNTNVGTVNLTGMDVEDIYADEAGGVVLLTRDANGTGGTINTLNCGNPANLCGTPPSPAIACYDMYLVRFDGTSETWATQLTQTSPAHPAYLNSKTDTSNVIFVWWYAHQGRIVSDGTNYASYYGAAISVSQSGCVNIHQGDEMEVVSPAGTRLTGHNSFDWGCSHSGYERIVWDPKASKFVTVCKNDAPTGGKSGRLAFAPATTTIYPLDLYYSNMGNITLGGGGGYWLTTSDIRAGQTANTDGLADVHLLHFTTGTPDKDLTLASDAGLNDRAPHLAQYGASHLLASWDSSTAVGDLTPTSANRKMYVQVLDSTSGAAVSSAIQVAITNNRYQEMKPYPDGSVAYPGLGSAKSKVKILRVLPCN